MPATASAHPLVSVVTVCRNALEDLRLTIDSVSRQTWPSVEHIVVDGASSDGTPDFLASRPGLKWMSEPDRGIYDAMNKGVALASGSWVVFMNAADRFAADDVLARIFADGDIDADIVYGDVLKGVPPMLRKAEPPHNSHRMFFCHQSCLARREALAADPFDISHPLSADFKWVKRAWKRGLRFRRLDFPVAWFDTGGVSNTRRSAGLADNIRVIREEDSIPSRLRFIPKLSFTLLICRLRHK